GLAKLAFQDDVSIESDPKSADFGEIKIGNTRLNPTAGVSTALRFVWRMVAGKYKSTDTGQVRPMNRGQVLGNEIRAKLAPVPSAAWTGAEVATGTKAPPGYPSTAAGLVADVAVPVTAEDFYKACEDQGNPRGVAIGLGGRL